MYYFDPDYSEMLVQMPQRADSRNSDLIEELGQIEFVFSDKTGTLT